MPPIEILQLIHTYAPTDIYPNIEIALQIFLTIPVTVTSCERSFSKLKLVKNYLRSTVGQERLTSLSIVSIEYYVAISLNYDSIIDDCIIKSTQSICTVAIASGIEMYSVIAI